MAVRVKPLTSPVPRIRNRDQLQYLIKDMQAAIGRSEKSLRRKRKLGLAEKIMTMGDLGNKLALLKWVERIAETMPADIQITENGEEI